MHSSTGCSESKALVPWAVPSVRSCLRSCNLPALFHITNVPRIFGRLMPIARSRMLRLAIPEPRHLTSDLLLQPHLGLDDSPTTTTTNRCRIRRSKFELADSGMRRATGESLPMLFDSSALVQHPHLHSRFRLPSFCLVHTGHRKGYSSISEYLKPWLPALLTFTLLSVPTSPFSYHRSTSRRYGTARPLRRSPFPS